MRILHRLALVVAGGMAVAAISGLTLEDLYRDNALVTAGWLGNDAVTLLVGVPILLASLSHSHHGSPRGTLVLLGMLLYGVYTYCFYLFGAAFNALFLVYVAIVAAAGFGLLSGLVDLDMSLVEGLFHEATPGRAVAAFMIAVGALLGAFWVVTSAAFLVRGASPPMVAATGHPTNVTGALDLLFVVPLALLAGIWLWRRRPWGFALAVIWNVKGAVYMLALSGASTSAWRAHAGSLAQLALWAPIGLGCGAAALGLLRSPPVRADHVMEP